MRAAILLLLGSAFIACTTHEVTSTDGALLDDGPALDDGALLDDGPEREDERPACDPSRHIDCLGGASCAAGIVKRLAVAPYPCCTSEQCARAFANDICTIERHPCASGACDDRRFRCNTAALRALTRTGMGFDLEVLCAGGGRREGDPCTTDADCVPQVEGEPGRLRCMRGTDVCVRAPRPTTARGAPCVWDDDCAEGDRCDCSGPTGGARVCVGSSSADAGRGDADAGDVALGDGGGAG